MNSQSPYHRILSLIIVGVLCWNFAGTLVLGLVMNHLHTQGEGSYCEVSFCTCSVEKGQKICTCHHPELQHKNHSDEKAANNHHSSSEGKTDFCYFSTHHADGNGEPVVVIEFNKFNAVYILNSERINSYNTERFLTPHNARLSSGIANTLFKPPRVA